MTRKEFIAVLGVGAAVATCTACLTGCKPQDTIAAPPTNVDFTLNLGDGGIASGLNGTGYYNNGIIVVKTSNGNYVAVSSTCTHQGSTVFYDRNGNRFYCPSHGSAFNTNGGVIQGPASSPLAKYKTTLINNGASLRVQS